MVRLSGLVNLVLLLLLTNDYCYAVELDNTGTVLSTGYAVKQIWLIILAVISLLSIAGLVFYNYRLYKSNRNLAFALKNFNDAKVELNLSEQRFSSVLNNSPAVIYVKDRDGRFLFINHQFEKLFNVTNEGIQGMTTHDIFPQEIADQHRAHDLKILETGAPVEIEETAPVEGKTHYYLSSKFCLFDEVGVPYAVCGISTDITERKNVEAMLKQHGDTLENTVSERTAELNNLNDLLHAVLDTIPARVFWKDLDCQYLGCNKAFLKDAGFDGEVNILGKNDYDLAWSDQAEAYRADDRYVMETGEYRLAFEEPQTTPDGDTIWLETSKIPLRKPDGEVYGVLGTYTEITERKQFEARLIKAKEEAEAANRAKSEFLAKMSHELRTPLHGILSYASLGINRVETVPADKIKKYFSQISVSGERLKVLLDDLLDLSKLEAGKMKLDISRHSIRPVIENCVEEQEALLDSRQLSVVWDFDSVIPDIECDKNRIGQICMNILSNAIKFSPDGGQITITGRVCKFENDKDDSIDAIEIAFADQGKGVPPGEEKMVFKKFIQSSNNSTTVSGTGLGLAITWELINAHGGKVWCENSSSGGAVFYFILPVQQ